MKIKNLLILALIFISFQVFSQAKMELTKENICKGAAISVVANVKPMIEAGMPKSEILEFCKEELVKDVIKDAPKKAYDLLKENKSREQVIDILFKDFMKLDDKTVFEFLLKADPNYQEDEDEYEDDED